MFINGLVSVEVTQAPFATTWNVNASTPGAGVYMLGGSHKFRTMDSFQKYFKGKQESSDSTSDKELLELESRLTAKLPDD